MCQHKSGIVVRVDETTVKVFCLPGEDSHSKIREKYKISDSNAIGRFQTPVEFKPVRGIENIDQYDFVFDAEKPYWWKEEFEQEAKRVLFRASQEDLASEFPNDLYLSSLTSLPANAKLTAGGGLYLSSLTSLPANAKLTAGGDLYLRSLTSLPANAKLTAGGYLYLRYLTSLPANAKLTAGGGLYLSSLTSLPANAKLTAGGGLYLSSLTSLPANAKLTAGGDLDLSSVPKEQVAEWKATQSKK